MQKDTEEIFSQRKVDLIHSAFIAHTLYQQQKLGKYCDLKVLVGDKQYFVHRCILAAASAQLDSQINGLDTIQLVGVTYYGFECLLEILYSGKLKEISILSDSKFQQIVSAADALNAQIVMDYCTRERGDLMQLLLSQTDPNNILRQKTVNSSNSATSQSSDNDKIKTTLEDATSATGEAAQVPNAEIKVETESYKSDELYRENSVAAEVEVGASQKLEGQKFGEETEVVSSLQKNLFQNEQSVPAAVACTVCGMLFQNSSDLNLHMRVHMNDPLCRCDICGLHFKLESALVRHKLSHCICQFCGQEFKAVHEVQQHIQERHPDHMLAARMASEPQTVSAKPSRAPKKRSGVTPSMSRNKMGAGKPAINPVVVNEIMRGADGKYQCPLCDRGFDRRWNLKCHVLIHTAPEKDKSKEARYAEAVFTCPECGKLFRNLHNLRRHASSMHGMSATDLEGVGEGASTEYGTIKKPRKEASDPDSSGDYKFWCPVCGRGFKRNRNLRGHMESHQTQNEAKYECPVCQRKFAQKESLNGHLWVHRANKGEGEIKSDFV